MSCFEVQHDADDVARELEQLAGHGLLEPVDARDAVADLDDATDLLEVDLRLVARELALDDLADLSGLDHVYPLPARQTLPHARELTIETAVHDEAADLGDEAAEQILVERLVYDDLLALEGAARAALASAVRSPSVRATAARTWARTRP